MREHNDDKRDEREHHQDLPLGRRQITGRNQQTLYIVEERHAALDGDAAHLCFAGSAARGVLCHDLPNHSKPVQAVLFSYPYKWGS